MKKLLLVFTVFVLAGPDLLWATHFRFGHLSWVPTGNPGEVEFHLVNAFRRDGYLGTAPDLYPRVGDIITEDIGETEFDFGDGALTPVLQYVVTSYSVAQNYIIAEALQPGTTNRFIRHIYTGSGPYTAGISSCCRIDGTGGFGLNNRSSGDYRVQTTVTPTSGNRSPVSSLFPIITVPETNNASFSVPAADPDGDSLRWRISTDAEAGGGISPPNLTINPNTGQVTWNTVGLNKVNFWTVQVIIEDLDGSSNVLSRIPVDFLLLVSTNSANRPPVCTINPPGPITSYVGQPISFVVTGSDPDTNDRVTLNTGGLPQGATMTPGLPVTGNSNTVVQSTFNWTPTGQQGGTYQLVFSASDTFGFQTLAPIILNVAPVLVPGGQPSVLSETCLSTNGAVDPGETVTVSFPIKNTGKLGTTNVVATLLATGNVTLPSGPQTYGAIPSNGVVSRNFSFRANGPCGGLITATLQLQEVPNALGQVNYPIVLGTAVNVLTENFDTVTAPNLPPGWTAALQGAGTAWATTSAVRHSTPNSAFAPNPATASTNDLTLPAFTIPTAGLQLSFQQNYSTESGYDGGVLEISINGGAFTDIIAAGGSFATNGYNGIIVGGRQAWTGNSGGFRPTIVNLPPAATGQSIRLRWRLITDSSAGATGWYVDTIAVAGGQSCCIDPSYIDLALTKSALPDSVLIGAPLSYSLAVTNKGPATATGVIVTNTLPPFVNFVSASSSQGSCTYSNGIVTCNLATLAANAGATIAITVTPTAPALLANNTSVNATQYDFNRENNTASTTNRAVAGLFISSGSIVEGNTGTTSLVFNVSTPAPLSQTLSVNFSTIASSATSGVDYLATNGSLIFPPGVTNLAIPVSINGDLGVESNETFMVALSNPSTNGLLVVSNGVGTIINDDDVDYFLWSAISNPQLLNQPFAVTITAIGAGQVVSNFNRPLSLSQVAGGEIIVGNGTGTANYPLGTFYHDERTQVIYLSSELGGGGRISGLALNVATIPGQMNNWTIRMKHTTLSSYASASWESSGWTVVYQANQTVSTTGWVVFTLTTPFDYNGTDNLMIDFSFNNSSFTSDGLCRISSTAQPRTIYYRTDSGFGDPLTWSGTSPFPTSVSQIPNVKLTMQAQATTTITPTNASNFVNGVWSGNMTIQGTGTNIVLKAADAEGRFGLSNPFGVYPPGQVPPIIQQQPQNASTTEGSSVTFTVIATGTAPLSYQWRFNGTNTPTATGSSLSLTNVTAAQEGNYSVLISNAFGVAISADAVLAIGEFKILDLSTNSSYVVDHDTLTGDDRGGIAASATRVFYTGDSSTARFALADLSGGTALGVIRDALVSDLKTETVYSLGNGTNPIVNPGGTVTTLLQMEGNTGALTGNSITLSTPLTLPSGSGIFAGYGRIVLHNLSRVYSIALPSGNVTDLGAMTMPSHVSSENWAFWGVAEFFGGAVQLVYVQNSTSIVRTRVPDGQTTPVAAFFNLNDMAAFTVSIRSNRWYFHHEGTSQFGGLSETIGYASGAFLSAQTGAPVSPVIIIGSKVGNNFSFSFQGESGRTYVIQYKDTLNAPGWTFLQTLPGSGGPVNVLDTTATGPTRFYRVQVQ